MTVTDPLPPDFDEDRIIRETQQRIRRAVKGAINNFLIQAAPGEDVVYTDLVNAIQNLVSGVDYSVERLSLRATSLADGGDLAGEGRVQKVPWVVGDQTLMSDIHIRSVEVAFMQPIPIEPPPPFSLDPGFQGDLDLESGQLSTGLRTALTANDIYLSDDVTIKKTEAAWLIEDREQERTYLVRREGDVLNGYQQDPIQVQVTVEKVIVPGR